MMRLPPRSKYSFQMFNVTPFLVLKDLRKLNTTIQLIRSHIELNNDENGHYRKTQNR